MKLCMVARHDYTSKMPIAGGWAVDRVAAGMRATSDGDARAVLEVQFAIFWIVCSDAAQNNLPAFVV